MSSKSPPVSPKITGAGGGRKKGGQSSGLAPPEKIIHEATEHDVLLGRGKGAYLSKGNQRLLQIVSLYLPAYMAANKNKEKIQITNEIVTEVKSGGGRFLCEDRVGKLFEAPDQKARIKVAQAIRHKRRLYEDEAKEAAKKAAARRQELTDRMDATQFTSKIVGAQDDFMAKVNGAAGVESINSVVQIGVANITNSEAFKQALLQQQRAASRSQGGGGAGNEDDREMLAGALLSLQSNTNENEEDEEDGKRRKLSRDEVDGSDDDGNHPRGKKVKTEFERADFMPKGDDHEDDKKPAAVKNPIQNSECGAAAVFASLQAGGGAGAAALGFLSGGPAFGAQDKQQLLAMMMQSRSASAKQQGSATMMQVGTDDLTCKKKLLDAVEHAKQLQQQQQQDAMHNVSNSPLGQKEMNAQQIEEAPRQARASFESNVGGPLETFGTSDQSRKPQKTTPISAGSAGGDSSFGPGESNNDNNIETTTTQQQHPRQNNKSTTTQKQYRQDYQNALDQAREAVRNGFAAAGLHQPTKKIQPPSSQELQYALAQARNALRDSNLLQDALAQARNAFHSSNLAASLAGADVNGNGRTNAPPPPPPPPMNSPTTTNNVDNDPFSATDISYKTENLLLREAGNVGYGDGFPDDNQQEGQPGEYRPQQPEHEEKDKTADNSFDV